MDYAAVMDKIQALSAKDGPVIVAVDGRCGSGKTHLADLITGVFQCNLFHMDDFYLPVSERPEEWWRTAGANMDLDRFLSEVITPVRAGREVAYRVYDCGSGEYAPDVRIAPCRLNIVEGSYSQHPLLASDYDLKIFLTCSGEVQEERLRKREGKRFSAFVERWIPLEEQYIRTYGIEQKADLVVDTTEA